MRIEDREIVELSYRGGLTEKDNYAERTKAQLILPEVTERELIFSQKEISWPSSAAIKIRAIGLNDDLVWPSPIGAFVVSNRLKLLWERHVSGQVVFKEFAQSRDAKNRVLPECSYWFVDFPVTTALLSEERTRWIVNSSMPGGRRVGSPVFDTRLLPTSISIVCPTDYRSIVIIRQQLRRIMEDAGIRGSQYYACSYVDSRGEVVP